MARRPERVAGPAFEGRPADVPAAMPQITFRLAASTNMIAAKTIQPAPVYEDSYSGRGASVWSSGVALGLANGPVGDAA